MALLDHILVSASTEHGDPSLGGQRGVPGDKEKVLGTDDRGEEMGRKDMGESTGGVGWVRFENRGQ